ncbi:MAG: ATP-binding cassette domain-containing protein [Streptosporangiales bacterium]|nr:ATP-binding cassette domain-containing protein [Streptosporangiales bacterium]
MSDPVLRVSGAEKHFGAVQALRDVDLDVHGGEVVALVGDNGAGKSTLIKGLAGVQPFDAGSIEIGGHPARITTPQQATGLGIATVYQDLALCDNLDVVANLFLGNEPLRLRRLDEVAMEKQAHGLLAQLSVSIPSVRTRVASLSGGQRQSVAIARSLIGEPRVVLLDEPTAALGVAQTAQVLQLVTRLRERGLAVLLISHNLADVFAVADRIEVLRLGGNGGSFRAADARNADVVAAITGATKERLDAALAEATAEHSADASTAGGERS